MRVTAPQVRLWSREEYYKMAEAGIFAPDERVELIEGEIVARAAQGSLHATAVCLAQEALRTAFGPGFYVRTQFPLSLDPYSEPEPDLAVVPGSPRDYTDAHPLTALLVVEVANETLAFDRGRKARLYAKSGVPEYWIVNVPERLLEAYRDPGPLPGRPSEHGYRSVSRFSPPESVTPLAPGVGAARVADLLP